MIIFFSICLATVQITQNRISATEVPFAKYRSLLTKNYSRRWLHQLSQRQSSTNPYCNLCCLNITHDAILKDCGFHTLCIYKAEKASSHCKGFMHVKFTEAEKYTILDAHNTLRNKVARGNESKGNPGPQPSAANMRRLEWDDELATIAEGWTTQCSAKHDRCRDVERFPVGQNIATDYASRSNNLEFIQNWYITVENFNTRNIHRYRPKLETNTEQYTQMIWAETYRVGCARAVYQSTQGSEVIYREIFVCNYGPSGNIPGQPVYIQGSPCSACYRGTRCEPEYPALCGRICDDDDCNEEHTQYPSDDDNRKFPQEDDEIAISDPKMNYNGRISSFNFFQKCLMMSVLVLHSII